MTMRKVPESMLFVSEPSPYMFGNGANPKDDPKWTNGNWLKSRFHFSFAEYHNARNSRFGALRVMNDDLVQPGRGFGSHPHANMEIVTYVVQGQLAHADSNGNQETLGRHSTQFMSAGKGVVHSEFNGSKDEPVRFVQMWIPPRKTNAPTRYGSSCGDADALRNKWQHLVSDDENTRAHTPVKIAQDVNMFVTVLDAGKALDLGIGDERQAYLLCVEGTATLTTTPTGDSGGKQESEVEEVQQHDAAELFGGAALRVEAGSEGAHVLVVEMAKDGSSRFA